MEETLQAPCFTDAGLVGFPKDRLALSLLLSNDCDVVASGTVMAPNVPANTMPGLLSQSISRAPSAPSASCRGRSPLRFRLLR